MARQLRCTPSFRTQLAISFGVLSLGLTVFLSGALVTIIWSQAENAKGDALEAVSVNVANALAEDLRKTSHSVNVLANSEAIWKDGLASPAVKSMLARIQTVNPDNTWIGVANNAGVVQAATGDILVGQDVSERPWFKPGTQGPHIGDVHAAKLLAGYLPPASNGEPRRFVDFSAPVVLNGRHVGVLAIHGSWEWVDTVVHKLMPDRADVLQIETFIFDRNGQMVYAAHPGELSRYQAAGQTLPQRKAAASSSLVWRDGQAYLTAFDTIPPITGTVNLGWTIVTRQPIATAMVGAWTGSVTAVVFGTMGALLSVLFGWRVSTRLARPLVQIAKAAKLVADGQATAIPAQGGPREVEELSGALDNMTAKLVTANAELEARVRERTEELVAANEALARLARLDPLTGLPNRRAFDERSAQLITAARRSGKPLSVIVIDADHFKRVNDVHGHAMGDTTLLAIAHAMRSRLRDQDVVARIGGEEFAAILPETDSEGALIAAEKVVACVRTLSIPVVGAITVSCGAAEVVMPEGDVAEALDRADKALYRAKSEGRDRAVLDTPDAYESNPAEVVKRVPPRPHARPAGGFVLIQGLNELRPLAPLFRIKGSAHAFVNTQSPRRHDPDRSGGAVARAGCLRWWISGNSILVRR